MADVKLEGSFVGGRVQTLWSRLSRQTTGRRRWILYILEFGLLGVALAMTQVLAVKLWLLGNGDVTEYVHYAQEFWLGSPPFHALPVEYPPLAIVPFSLTLLPPLPDYHTVFAVWMGALVILGYIGFLKYAGRARAMVYIGYLLAGTAATLIARFDIVPALATLLALWMTERGKFGYAYVLIAVGILLKLYPGFLLPIVMIEHWKVATNAAILRGEDTDEAARSWWQGNPVAVARKLWQRPATRLVVRGTSYCLLLVAFGFGVALAISPAGALSGFMYAGNRPLQVESTPATLLWLGTLFGIPANPNYSFVSLNYVGPLDVMLKPLSAIALAAGCLWVYWRHARGNLRVGQAFVACLAVVIVANKIFSPQYLIWILPLVAYVDGFDVMWLAIAVLTWLDFPIVYQMRHPIWTVPYSWQFMPLLAVRNGLLLWATVRAIIRPRSRVLHVTRAEVPEEMVTGQRAEETEHAPTVNVFAG